MGRLEGGNEEPENRSLCFLPIVSHGRDFQLLPIPSRALVADCFSLHLRNARYTYVGQGNWVKRRRRARLS